MKFIFPTGSGGGDLVPRAGGTGTQLSRMPLLLGEAAALL